MKTNKQVDMNYFHIENKINNDGKIKKMKILYLIVIIFLINSCFVNQPFTKYDKLSRNQLKKMPISNYVFIAKYFGTQTSSELYFRNDSIFSLHTRTNFSWEQFIGEYKRFEKSDTFSLIYFNEHKSKWNYLVLCNDKALLKNDLKDTTLKLVKHLQVFKNIMTK